jgi:predicted lipoprotein with Yx(FWY)xxD motif
VLYTSAMDRKPGDTIGGTKIGRRSSDPPGSPGGDAPAYRVPIGPSPDVPGQFVVDYGLTGHQLTLANGFSVYTWDGDRPNKSNCTGACLRTWQPVLAPEVGASAREEWTVIERSPGVKQWAFRGRPLYTYGADPGPGTQHGVDVPGWNIVFTQLAPPPPPEFTRQESAAGIVLADAKGKTIYIYNCGDDAVDQQLCDHPDMPQEYRYAVCGGGSPARCLTTFPYVIAANGAKGANEAWSVMAIDPQPGQADALQVWAYRDRPVFTFARDDRPGSIRAQNWGEFYGQRNGYKAFFLREEFQGR